MTGQARGHLAMLAFSALVAGSFSLGVMAAPHIDPAALTALRFWLAAAIVGSAAALTTGLPRHALQAPWRYLLLGGTFGIYFVLMFEGLKSAQAVSASAVFTLTPVIAGIAGWFLLRQITTPRMALALAIGAMGAVWVIFRADLAALARFQIGRGEAIFFVGCIAHAVYTPMVRKLNRGEPPVVFTFGMLIGGGLLVTAWAWPAIRATDWLALPGIVWITLAYVSVFASAATFVLLQYATMHLPSAKVMAYTYLTPSWVILLEFALGNGLPTPWVLGGVALTMVALLMLLRDDSATPAPIPQSP
jgi:drug/metabolite transporter (DMT)-like permease